VIPQRPDAPDMVYAMNLGLAVARRRGDGGLEPHVVLSHMRYAQRRMETASAQPWFAAHGFTTSYVGRHGVGAHLEAGDIFPFGDGLVAGYGPRTEELALKHLAADLGVRVRGLRITHPGMYHLDLAFCPLDEGRAIICPDALDAESARVLLELVPEPLVLTEEEALTTFAANSIVVPSDSGPGTVVMPAAPDHVREQLEAWGFDVELVDVSEFHKGGGSIRCLSNPLDIEVGRDLPAVPGGEVVLPPV
jgi:N-dimethylarginine dimethylaminohydrolase